MALSATELEHAFDPDDSVAGVKKDTNGRARQESLEIFNLLKKGEAGMAHAKVSTQEGISIEIDGTPEEVSAVVEKLRQDQARQMPAASKPAVRQKQGKPQIADLIEILRADDFFRKPKGLGEVRAKLAEMGHHYPVTTLSGAMQTEAKHRRLRRFKQNGKYVYVQ